MSIQNILKLFGGLAISLKRKKWKFNYYILAFFIFIGVIVFIDFKLEGTVAEYFERQILFDREKVPFIEVTNCYK